MKKSGLLFLLFLFLLSSKICAFDFMTGDLIFEVDGKSDFSGAITKSTARSDSLSLVHVAMVVVNPDSSERIIEASPQEGVRMIPVSEFINSATRTPDGKPALLVKRLNIPFSKERVVGKALLHLGEPYDWYYLPDNGMSYCSELIYDAFIDDEGNHIFTASPMNFRDKNGEMPQFWLDLFKKLGVEVPEGIPGTNPNDLFRDPRLDEVYRYF